MREHHRSADQRQERRGELGLHCEATERGNNRLVGTDRICQVEVGRTEQCTCGQPRGAPTVSGNSC